VIPHKFTRLAGQNYVKLWEVHPYNHASWVHRNVTFNRWQTCAPFVRRCPLVWNLRRYPGMWQVCLSCAWSPQKPPTPTPPSFHGALVGH
jgi:hypothetical protein